MKTKLIDLNRKFQEVGSSDFSKPLADWPASPGRTFSFSDILKNRCSVIFGSANAGKTSEFRLQTKRLRKNSEHACFVAVRELLEAGSLEEALEPDEAAALRKWSHRADAPLYLFVDSVDEAALASARELRNCLSKLHSHVSAGANHVTWVVSTRPAALNLEMITAIEDALGFRLDRYQALNEATPASLEGAEESHIEDSRARRSTEVFTLAKTYRLLPLTRKQAGEFLEKVARHSDPDQAIRSATVHGLNHLLTTPGKLKLLVQMDLLAHPPASLEQAYRRTVDAQFSAPTSGRKEKLRSPRDTFELEGRRLACASTLCQRLNIEIPAEDDTSNPQSLSARTLVGSLLDKELAYLLSLNLFEDTGHQQVKIEPDDLRFYLTARRLSELVHGREDARRVAQVLGWRAPTGESGIFPQFLPVAGWLAALNQYFRAECLQLDAQCAAFFGDLRSWPISDAKAALAKAVQRLVSGERVGRGMYYLTAENYWQAGGAELLPYVRELFNAHASNEDVRDVLLEIARTVNSPILCDDAFIALGRDYGRVFEDTYTLLYLASTSTPEGLAALTKASLQATQLPDRAIATLLEHCAWTHLTADDISALLDKKPAGNDSFSLRFAFTNEVIPSAPTSALLDLAQKLHTKIIERLPQNRDESCREQFDELEWLVEIVAAMFVELVDRGSDDSAIEPLSKAIARLQLDVLSRFDNTSDTDSLAEKLSVAGALRDAVIRELVDATAKWKDLELRYFLFRGKRVVTPTSDELKIPRAKRLRGIIKAFEESQVSRPAPARETPKKKSVARGNDEVKKDLRARSAGISAGTDVAALSWVAQVLSNTGLRTRYGEVNIEEFRKAYGKQLTKHVEHGLKALWRSTAPRKDNDNPRSTYWSTIAGLQGLGLEFENGAPANFELSGDEVSRALDYGLYELNGVPHWYWSVAAMDLDASEGFLRHTLNSAAHSPLDGERAAKVLTCLSDAPHRLQEALWQDVTVRVASGSLDVHQLDSVLSSLVSRDAVTPEAFDHMAFPKVFGEQPSENSAIWATHWLLLDAPGFLEKLAVLKTSSRERADKLLMSIATNLEDRHGNSFLGATKERPATALAIKSIYQELLAAVPREGDKHHPPGKAYWVDDRGRAENFRDRLPGMLAATETTAGYLALMELSATAAETREAHYLRDLARKTAEAMQRPERPMSESEFLEFEKTLRAPPGSLDAFAQEVENDILDVRDLIENGDFSPRRFLSTAFKAVSEDVIKSMEDEFQLYLAGLLEVLGRKRYSVVREPQLANATRRDISVHHTKGWKLTLELKVTEGGWTVEEYLASLRHQLVETYMKERGTTVGYFVVLRQSHRGWKTTDGDLDYAGLLERLEKEALQIEGERPQRLRLRVIGIDATEPAVRAHHPRAATSGSRAKKPATPSKKTAAKPRRK